MRLPDAPMTHHGDAQRRTRPLPRTALRIALFALGFRVVSAVLAFYANIAFPLYERQPSIMAGAGSPFWDTFTRFDAGWYYPIARNGYHYVAGGRNNLAFFPVYPLLMRYVGRLIGPRPFDYIRGGILVSWVAFVLAMIVLGGLARLDLPRRLANRAVLLTAIFPFAFFYGVVYTESVFLLFTVASFYGFRTRRWMLGGVCGGLATATRVNGIMMLPALAWIAWRTAADRREQLRAVIGLVLVCSGIGLYSLYVYQLTGDPLEWAASIKRWGYHPGGAPWLALFRLAQALITRPYAYLAGERSAPYDALNGVAAFAFVAAVPFVWRRFGAAYGLFMLANLWLPLSSGQYEGMGRYCSVLFPGFIWLASLRSRAIATSLVALFAMWYALSLALYTTTHPVF